MYVYIYIVLTNPPPLSGIGSRVAVVRTVGRRGAGAGRGANIYIYIFIYL